MSGFTGGCYRETVLFAVPAQEPLEIVIDPDEIAAVKNAWQAIQAVHASRSRFLKASLLRLYASPIERKYGLLGKPVIADHYGYAYWPLSDDHRLHYEFLFAGSKCEVSLHFEGKYAKYTDIIEEICASSVISLRNNPGQLKGCAIVCDEIHNNGMISDYMDYLIQLSLPILYRKRLLSDRLVLNPEARRICEQ